MLLTICGGEKALISCHYLFITRSRGRIRVFVFICYSRDPSHFKFLSFYHITIGLLGLISPRKLQLLQTSPFRFCPKSWAPPRSPPTSDNLALKICTGLDFPTIIVTCVPHNGLSENQGRQHRVSFRTAIVPAPACASVLNPPVSLCALCFTPSLPSYPSSFLSGPESNNRSISCKTWFAGDCHPLAWCPCFFFFPLSLSTCGQEPATTTSWLLETPHGLYPVHSLRITDFLESQQPHHLPLQKTPHPLQSNVHEIVVV